MHHLASTRDRRTHFNFSGTRGSSGGGGSGGNGSIQPWAPEGANTGSVTPVIETQPVITAPASVFLEASNISGLRAADESGTTYDHTQHEYDTEWRLISGPTLDPYTAPLQMYAPWNDPNVTYGQKAGMTLTKPGTYMLRVRVVDRNRDYAEAIRTIVVVDPDTVYTGAQNVVLSPASNFTDAPSGARQVTSVSAFESLIQGETNPVRVLIPAGETITGFHTNTSSGRLDHVQKLGDGANPKLRPAEFDMRNMLEWSTNDASTQVTIDSVGIEGYYDPATETGGHGGLSVLYWRNRNTSVVMLFHNMEIKNTTEVQASCNFAPCSIMFTNVDRFGWQDYGFLCLNNDNGKYAFLGTSSRQPVEALSGIDGPKQGIANQHGPWRFNVCLWVVADLCYGYSRNGWSGATAQPVWRQATNQSGTLGFSGHCGRSVFEGGYQIINLEGENTSAQDLPGNMRFDRMILIGSSTTNLCHVSCHKSGTSFVNMYHLHPNASNQQSSGFTGFYSFNANNSTGTNASEPVRVRNVTCISLLNAANESGGPASVAINTSGFNNFKVDAEVLHVPNSSSPVTGSAPLDMGDLPGVLPIFPGVKYNYRHAQGSGGSVPDGSSFTVPWADLAATDANGGGSGTVPTQGTWSAGNNGVLRYGGLYFQGNGDFTLTPTSSGLQVTNTSGDEWSGTYYLQPDRSNVIDSQLPLQTQFATPAALPMGRQQAGSNVIDPGGSDDYAISDFECALRSLAAPDAGVWQGVAS